MKTEPNYRVKFSTRGRVTIPAPLRKKYDLKAGSKVAFEVTPTGAFLLKPVAAKGSSALVPGRLLVSCAQQNSSFCF